MEGSWSVWNTSSWSFWNTFLIALQKAQLYLMLYLMPGRLIECRSDKLRRLCCYAISIDYGSYVLYKTTIDDETMTRFEAACKSLYPNYSLDAGDIYIFWKFHEYKSVDMDETTLEFTVDRLRLKELYLRMMIRCLIVFAFFLSLKLEISDRKAKIQEIKANIRDKYYKGNCKAKIGITPDPGGELKVCIVPFVRLAY